MSDAVPLPPRPDIEQYKKLAKDLKFACQSGNPTAIRDWIARFTKGEPGRVEQRWRALQEKNERAARCALSQMQFFVARECGFASWPKFVEHVAGLGSSDSPVSQFEAAVDAIVTGEAGTLKRLLQGNGVLVRARSTREHRSTLLHYVSANGVEDFRQKTPKNIVAIARMLIEAGADVNAASEAYGGGWTALGLVATSVHPQRAGAQIELLELLLEHGALMDVPYSIVNACLANGQPDAADFLAGRGAQLGLEGAAGLGRIEMVKSLLGNASEQQRKAAFRYACGYGQEDVVAFLLAYGNVDAEHIRVGLGWAKHGGHEGVIKILNDSAD